MVTLAPNEPDRLTLTLLFHSSVWAFLSAYKAKAFIPSALKEEANLLNPPIPVTLEVSKLKPSLIS